MSLAMSSETIWKSPMARTMSPSKDRATLLVDSHVRTPVEFRPEAQPDSQVIDGHVGLGEALHNGAAFLIMNGRCDLQSQPFLIFGDDRK